jgi:guanine nucleotide-binding protein subunit alpha
MGLCGSTPAEPELTSVVVSPDGTRAYPKGWTDYKLLILGTGGSGKSTIFKQAHILGDGFSDEDRRRWSVRIFSGLLQMTRGIVANIPDHGASAEESRLILTCGNGVPPGEKAAILYDELASWDDCLAVMGAVQAVLKNPAESERLLEKHQHSLLLASGGAMLLKIVPRICSPGFLASDDEILRYAYPTNDVQKVVADFPETKLAMQLVDVGGQRVERAKWSGLVKECQTVLFVSSLDDFHKTLVRKRTPAVFVCGRQHNPFAGDVHPIRYS